MQTYALFIQINSKTIIRECKEKVMTSFQKTKHQEMYRRVGLNVALQRKIKNMTQLELAEAINISRTHMSNIEAPNMVTPVSLEVIFDIAEVLQIKPEVLFRFDE